MWSKQLSLKTNWQLAERPFYNQNSKKNPHGWGKKEGETIRSGPKTLVGAREKKKDIMVSESLPGE